MSEFENQYLQEPLSKDAILKDQKSTIQKLRLEIKVLKEKLSVAESQIEDLKSQIAYWENGGGVS